MIRNYPRFLFAFSIWMMLGSIAIVQTADTTAVGMATVGVLAGGLAFAIPILSPLVDDLQDRFGEDTEVEQ